MDGLCEPVEIVAASRVSRLRQEDAARKETALMEACAETREQIGIPETAPIRVPWAAEPKWNLAFLGALAYLVIEYTRLPVMFPWMQSFDVGKVAVAIALFGLLLSPQAEKVKSSTIHSLDIVLGLFMLESIISGLGAPYQVPAWNQVITTFEYLVIYYILRRAVSSSWRMRVFALVYLLLNLKLAQFSLRGYAAARSAGYSVQVLSKNGVGAGSGFFGNAGDFGVAMCVVWGFTAPLIFGASKLWRRLLLLILFAIFTGAVIVSGSRGALLGIVAIAAFNMLRNPKRIMGFALILVVLLVGFYILPQANKNRLLSAMHPESDQTATERLTLWKAGMQMFYAHPILGIGPDNFSSQFNSHYAASTSMTGKWASSSIYIQALSELGLAGTLPLLLIWIMFFRMNIRSRRILRSLFKDKARRRFEYRLSLGADLAMVGFLASGAFLTVLYYPHLWVLLGISAGLHAASIRLAATQNSAGEAEQSDAELAPVEPGGY